MPGINSKGTPNVQDYNLGRGIVYFATLDANGLPLEYRDLGNAPEFSVTVTTEVLDHKSSRKGLKVIDKELVVAQEVKIVLTLDEINFDNLASFLSGSSGTKSNAASVAGVVPDALGNLYVIDQGRWYDLYDTTKGIAGITVDTEDHRIYDIVITSVKSLDGVTTYVLGTDYLVDLIMGRIFVVAGGAMTGLAAPGKGYKVAIAANGAAVATVDQVQALQTSGVYGALKFISSDPADKDWNTEYQFHQVLLKATGDFALISDAVTIMKFEAVAELNANADPDSPYMNVRTHAHAHS